jgi:hypothetical protein
MIPVKIVHDRTGRKVKTTDPDVEKTLDKCGRLEVWKSGSARLKDH